MSVEVLNISQQGIWLYVNGREYLLAYNDYPWFKDAKVSEIHDVQLLHNSHLHWPSLDVDLEIHSLANRGSYPLIYR